MKIQCGEWVMKIQCGEMGYEDTVWISVLEDTVWEMGYEDTVWISVLEDTVWEMGYEVVRSETGVTCKLIGYSYPRAIIFS